MLTYLTAGESHGPQETAIIEGIPASLAIDVDQINAALASRQGGYGRGSRQQIEHDQVEILGGVRHGLTLGSPITLVVKIVTMPIGRRSCTQLTQPPRKIPYARWSGPGPATPTWWGG